MTKGQFGAALICLNMSTLFSCSFLFPTPPGDLKSSLSLSLTLSLSRTHTPSQTSVPLPLLEAVVAFMRGDAEKTEKPGSPGLGQADPSNRNTRTSQVEWPFVPVDSLPAPLFSGPLFLLPEGTVLPLNQV